MPRIRDLSRWLFRRIKKPGGYAYFKIIHRSLYKSNAQSYLKYAIVAAVHLTQCDGKNRVILILYSADPIREFPFESNSHVVVKEFTGIVGAINFIEGWFRRDTYVYYYPKPKKVM